MRTIGSQLGSVLRKGHQSVFVRVEIDSDGSGTFQNMSDLLGIDWVQSVAWGENSDSPVSTCNVALWREYYGNSLSPFIGGSRFNASQNMIDIDREIKIYTATLPEGYGRPDSSSSLWELMFHGYIDELDPGGLDSKIEIRARDLGGKLQDTFIEAQETLGLSSGDPIEDVIQDILDNNGLSSITLYTPASPSFLITEYLQQKETVAEAIQKLVNLIGWECRYRYDSGTSSFRLTLYEPARSASTADYTFTADQYSDVSQLAISKSRIRNVVRVTYGTGTDRTTAEVSDSASITKYGRRFMEITEGASSQIDTLSEAQAMANAILSDLKDPGAECSLDFLEMHFSPVQLGDYVGIASNRTHFDADQNFGVVGYNHEIQGDKASTKIALRGKPSSGTMRWLRIEGRRGVAPNNDFVGPADASNVSTASAMGALVITYDEPQDPDWAYSEVYIDTSPISTGSWPSKPSSSLLAARQKTNRFEINGLIPGETYYGVIIIEDIRGNWNNSITFSATATQMVGPYHENPDAQFGTMLPNPDFGINTFAIADQPPDFWNVNANSHTGGSWAASGSKSWFHDASTFLTGKRSIRKNSDGTGSTVESAFSSDFIVVETGELYRADCVFLFEVLTGTPGSSFTDSYFSYFVEWYDSAKSYLSASNPRNVLYTSFIGSISLNDLADSQWYKDRGWVTAPSNAKFAKICAWVRTSTLTTGTFNIFVDALNVDRGLDQVWAYPNNEYTIAQNSWLSPAIASEGYDAANGFTTGSSSAPSKHTYTTPMDGEYMIKAFASLASATSGTKLTSRLKTSGGTVIARGTQVTLGFASSGNDYTESVFEGYLDEGTIISFEIYHNDSAARQILAPGNSGSIYDAEFRVKQLSYSK